jgi:hypothetical protein
MLFNKKNDKRTVKKAKELNKCIAVIYSNQYTIDIRIKWPFLLLWCCSIVGGIYNQIQQPTTGKYIQE